MSHAEETFRATRQGRVMGREEIAQSGEAATVRPRNFTVMCWPGAGSFVSAREWDSDRTVLVLYLNPVSLVLSVSPLPEGELTMARFCRQLASEASRVAAELDPESAGPGGGRS